MAGPGYWGGVPPGPAGGVLGERDVWLASGHFGHRLASGSASLHSSASGAGHPGDTAATLLSPVQMGAVPSPVSPLLRAPQGPCFAAPASLPLLLLPPLPVSGLLLQGSSLGAQAPADPPARAPGPQPPTPPQLLPPPLSPPPPPGSASGSRRVRPAQAPRLTALWGEGSRLYSLGLCPAMELTIQSTCLS